MYLFRQVIVQKVATFLPTFLPPSCLGQSAKEQGSFSFATSLCHSSRLSKEKWAGLEKQFRVAFHFRSALQTLTGHSITKKQNHDIFTLLLKDNLYLRDNPSVGKE